MMAIPICPHCAEPLDSGDQFCGYCGKRLTVPPASAKSAPEVAPPPGRRAAWLPVAGGVAGAALLVAALWLAWPYLPFAGDAATAVEEPPAGTLLDDTNRPTVPAADDAVETVPQGKGDPRDVDAQGGQVVITLDPLIVTGDTIDLGEVDDELRRALETWAEDAEDFDDEAGLHDGMTVSSEAFETSDWSTFRPTGGDVTYSVDLPMDWIPEMDDWVDTTGRPVSTLAPGLVLLRPGQTCLDGYGGPAGGSREETRPFGGPRPGVVQRWRVPRAEGLHYVYCVADGRYAFMITFYGRGRTPSDDEAALFERIAASFRVLDES